MEKTLAIIKPDAVQAGHIGAILEAIEKSSANFRMLGLKIIRLEKAQGEQFYAEHKERPFFGELVGFMSEGPIVVCCLATENAVAVAEWRKLIGTTDPSKADEGTIRQRFGTSIERNAVHGSDSPENGLREVNFFFQAKELLLPNNPL